MNLQQLTNWLGKGPWPALKAKPCPTCKQPTAQGPSDNLGAHWVTCDPTPLTILGEAHALLNGQHTYTATRHNTSTHLTPRTQGRRHPPGQYDIWADHQCGTQPTHTTQTRLEHTTHHTPKPNTPPPF